MVPAARRLAAFEHMPQPTMPRRALTLLVWFAATACTQLHSGEAPATRPTRIPFTLTEANNLSIDAVLNGTEHVALMFHTAVDSLSLTKDAIARIPGLQLAESVDVQSWGGTTRARHGAGNSLQIGKLQWQDLDITESENSGPGTDGKFGPNLFAGNVLEIDFDARELILHDSLPPLDPSYERLALKLERTGMFVTGEITLGEHRYQNEFLIHSGFGGTALLADQFVADHDLRNQLEVLGTSELKDSYGNVLRTRTVRLPTLRFGSITFSDVTIAIFEGAIGQQQISVLGGSLLKRFHLVFDLAHSQLFVKASSQV
jgi:hypothetical protein